MLKLSEGANIAVHALGHLSNQSEPITAAQIAEELDISRDHLSKVLQRLVKLHMVSSQRGPKGGFVLAADATRLTLLEVVEAIEGNWDSTHCIMGGAICGDHCSLHELTHDIHKRLRETLGSTTLADLPKLSAKARND